MAGGRIRTIKPELLEDEKIGVLSSDQFRVFIALLLLADDHGNFRSNPVWLHGQIFWGVDDPRETVASTRECVRVLADAGLIQLYSDEGQQYGHVTNWAKHQKIDRPSKPKLPLPTAENLEKKPDVGQPREPSRDCREPSTQTRDGSGSGSGSGPGSGSGGECEGNQNQTSEPNPPNPPTPPTPPEPPKVADAPAPSKIDSVDKGTIPEPQSAPKRKARNEAMPEGWTPKDSHKAKAKELGLNLSAEAEAFADFHVARDNKFADWDRAFHTWLRNATKYGPAVKTDAQESGEYIEVPEDSGPIMSLADALEFCPPEHRAPIQEFLGGIR